MPVPTPGLSYAAERVARIALPKVTITLRSPRHPLRARRRRRDARRREAARERLPTRRGRGGSRSSCARIPTARTSCRAARRSATCRSRATGSSASPIPITFSAYTTWEAPDPSFWVPRGYAVVNVDLRGFGTSEGVGHASLGPGSGRLRRGHRVGGGAAMVERQGRAQRRLVPRHQPVERGCAAPQAARRHLPVGGLDRRVPRRRVPRRRARGRLHPLLGRHDRARRADLGVASRPAARPSRLGRLLGRAHAGARAHRGAGADLRELLRPGPPHARQLRGLPPHRLGAPLPLHAPRRQVVHVLLARGAGRFRRASSTASSRARTTGCATWPPCAWRSGRGATRSMPCERSARGRCRARAGRSCTSRRASFASTPLDASAAVRFDVPGRRRELRVPRAARTWSSSGPMKLRLHLELAGADRRPPLRGRVTSEPADLRGALRGPVRFRLRRRRQRLASRRSSSRRRVSQRTASPVPSERPRRAARSGEIAPRRHRDTPVGDVLRARRRAAPRCQGPLALEAEHVLRDVPRQLRTQPERRGDPAPRRGSRRPSAPAAYGVNGLSGTLLPHQLVERGMHTWCRCCRARPHANEEPGSFMNATSSGVEARPRSAFRWGKRPSAG